jgi:hypothetical protein
MEVIKKESRTIRISQENYDKIVSEGDMTKSFDQVLTSIIQRADMHRRNK